MLCMPNLCALSTNDVLFAITTHLYSSLLRVCVCVCVCSVTQWCLYFTLFLKSAHLLHSDITSPKAKRFVPPAVCLLYFVKHLYLVNRTSEF